MNNSPTNVLVGAAEALSKVANLANSGDQVLQQVNAVKVQLASAIDVIEKSNSAVANQTATATRAIEQAARDIRSAHSDIIQLRRETTELTQSIAKSLKALQAQQHEGQQRLRRWLLVGFILLGVLGAGLLLVQGAVLFSKLS